MKASRAAMASTGRKRASTAASRSAPVTNRLLAALPASQLRRTLAGCEQVDLAPGQVLCRPGGRVAHAFFPLRCSISLVMPANDKDKASLEVGLVGNEGMFGIALALGIDAPAVGAVVQGGGAALRMNAAAFGRELARNGALRSGIDRYLFVCLHQLAQRVACNRFHLIEARLARQLLMTQDRADADAFRVTQEALALTLGVRRVGITRAAGSLQERRLIRYSRGRITIVDRRGLRAAACSCYHADRESYDRILG